MKHAIDTNQQKTLCGMPVPSSHTRGNTNEGSQTKCQVCAIALANSRKKKTYDPRAEYEPFYKFEDWDK